MSYSLSEDAEEDIIRIFIEGEALFGMAQAEKYNDVLYQLFEMLAEFPEISRLREEIRQPVRGHPHKSHIIFYSIEDDGNIVIRRIRHASEDWQEEMNEMDS